jgi:hypothetical protein
LRGDYLDTGELHLFEAKTSKIHKGKCIVTSHSVCKKMENAEYTENIFSCACAKLARQEYAEIGGAGLWRLPQQSVCIVLNTLILIVKFLTLANALANVAEASHLSASSKIPLCAV